MLPAFLAIKDFLVREARGLNVPRAHSPPATEVSVNSACLVMSAMPALANLLHALRGPSITGPSHNVSPALLDRTKMSEEALTANPVLQDSILVLLECHYAPNALSVLCVLGARRWSVPAGLLPQDLDHRLVLIAQPALNALQPIQLLATRVHLLPRNQHHAKRVLKEVTRRVVRHRALPAVLAIHALQLQNLYALPGRIPSLGQQSAYHAMKESTPTEVLLSARIVKPASFALKG